MIVGIFPAVQYETDRRPPLPSAGAYATLALHARSPAALSP